MLRAFTRQPACRRRLSVRTDSVQVELERLEARQVLVVSALGSLIEVPSRTIGIQVYDSIAADPQGNFTVVFSDQTLDSSGWGIYARRFAADGTPQGNQFRVNSEVSGNQFVPSIATNGQGQSLVVWRYEEISSGYSAAICLDYRILNSDGSPQGQDQNLIPYDLTSVDDGAYLEAGTWDYSSKPWTFADSQGQFWAVVPVTRQAVGYYGKEFQFWKVDPQGTATKAFQTRLVDESDFYTTLSTPIDVALGADGTFYVTYAVTRNKAVPDLGVEFNSKLIVQRISSTTGQPLGADIEAGSFTFYDDYYRNDFGQATVVPQSNGAFSVVYYTNPGDIVTQHFDSNGTKTGSLVKLIDRSDLNPGYSRSAIGVKTLSNGNWLVVWNVSVSRFDDDDSKAGVIAAEFRMDGTMVGSKVVLGPATYAGPPHVTSLPNQQFVVSWQVGGGIIAIRDG